MGPRTRGPVAAPPWRPRGALPCPASSATSRLLRKRAPRSGQSEDLTDRLRALSTQTGSTSSGYHGRTARSSCPDEGPACGSARRGRTGVRTSTPGHRGRVGLGKHGHADGRERRGGDVPRSIGRYDQDGRRDIQAWESVPLRALSGSLRHVRLNVVGDVDAPRGGRVPAAPRPTTLHTCATSTTVGRPGWRWRRR